MSFPRGLNTVITHWAFSASDGRGGSVFATPTEIKGRWEERHELFLNAAGEEIRSKSMVMVNVDVAEGDYLFEGTSIIADPMTVDDAHQVRAFARIPDIRNLAVTRMAAL